MGAQTCDCRALHIPGTPNNHVELMFGETTISQVKVGNHPIETTIYTWLFRVTGFSRKQKNMLISWSFGVVRLAMPVDQ